MNESDGVGYIGMAGEQGKEERKDGMDGCRREGERERDRLFLGQQMLRVSYKESRKWFSLA